MPSSLTCPAEAPSQPAVSPQPTLPRMAFSVTETAEILGLSVVTIRRLIRKGRLRTISGLRHRLVPLTEIQRLLRV